MSNYLLTPKELGDMLGLTRKTLSRYEKSGLLHPIKLNSRVVRYAQSDIDEMLLKFSQS